MSNINNLVSHFASHSLSEAAVPLFFIISGMLFYRDYSNSNYIAKIKRRFRSLFIPYIVWNVIGVLFAICTSYSFVSKYFIGREKFVISVTSILDGVFHHGCNGPFWFIFNLIVFSIFAPVINQLILTKCRAGITITAILVLMGFEYGLPENVFRSQGSIVYYILGASIGKHYSIAFTNKLKKNYALCSAVITITCTIVYFYLSLTNVTLPIVLNTVLLCIFALALWYGCDLFNFERIKLSWAKDSFLVFALHLNVSAIIVKLLWLLLPKEVEWALLNFVLTVMTTLTAIHVTGVLLRRCPKLYTCLVGERK